MRRFVKISKDILNKNPFAQFSSDIDSLLNSALYETKETISLYGCFILELDNNLEDFLARAFTREDMKRNKEEMEMKTITMDELSEKIHKNAFKVTYYATGKGYLSEKFGKSYVILKIYEEPARLYVYEKENAFKNALSRMFDKGNYCTMFAAKVENSSLDNIVTLVNEDYHCYDIDENIASKIIGCIIEECDSYRRIDNVENNFNQKS